MSGLVPTLVVAGLHQVFITRSPCVVPSHGRVLPTVCTRPAGMAPRLWEWLLALPFGAVLFSGAGNGPPLPLTIADGDLDGDLYFVCWDATLLSHIRPREPTGEAEMPSYPTVLRPDKQPISRGDEWLAQVQEKLADLSMAEDNRYVGKLHNMMVRRLEELGYENGMDDPDVQALGMGYTQGLVHDKHGGGIQLPTHLHASFK